MMQISINGILTFRNTLSSFFSSYPDNFPSSFYLPAIAPLWAVAKSGKIFCRQANDSATINRVAAMITDINPGLRDYQPQLVVIITWLELTFSYSSSRDTVSFVHGTEI